MDREERERRFVLTVRQRRDGMYRLALSMLRVPQDAEDAVSSAVEAAWDHLDRIRELDALPGYLMRCTVNGCRAIQRRRKREVPVEEMTPFVPAKGDPVGLWEYVQSLPEKYRLPLILRYSEDMSLIEVARALRITRSGASSRIQRGLRMLKRQMDGEVTGRG